MYNKPKLHSSWNVVGGDDELYKIFQSQSTTEKDDLVHYVTLVPPETTCTCEVDVTFPSKSFVVSVCIVSCAKLAEVYSVHLSTVHCKDMRIKSMLEP